MVQPLPAHDVRIGAGSSGGIDEGGVRVEGTGLADDIEITMLGAGASLFTPTDTQRGHTLSRIAEQASRLADLAV